MKKIVERSVRVELRECQHKVRLGFEMKQHERTSKQSQNEHYKKKLRSELYEFRYIIPRKVARSKQL